MTDLRDVERGIDNLRNEMVINRHLDIAKELFTLGEITKEEYVKVLKMYYEKG